MLSGLTECALEIRHYEHDNLNVFVLIAFIIFISRIMSMLRLTIFWVCSFEHLVLCVRRMSCALYVFVRVLPLAWFEGGIYIDFCTSLGMWNTKKQLGS